MWHQPFRVSCCALALTLLALGAGGQPVPTLQSPSTDTLRRGETTSLAVTGENLAGVSQILISGPAGLTATLTSAATQPTTKPTTVTLSITAAKDTPRGVRELRLVTPGGVTKPLTLYVDDLGATSEKEPNDDAGTAALGETALPAILAGKIEKDLDVDHFRFRAVKGQRLIFDMQAFRSGSKLDGSMAVLDAAGRRVAHDEDTNGLDPFIDFAVPADGVYTLKVQDLQYKGGPAYGYRIRAGELPHVDSVFPLGWRRGDKVELRLFGRNLGPTSRMHMSLDGDVGPMRRIEVPTSLGTSNAHPFVVSDLPEVTEAESAKDMVTEVTTPVVVNGRVSKENETDTFQFKCTATGPLVAEVAASRFGSRLDALLTLMDEKGAVIARNDDAPGTGADARLQFNAEAGKVYHLSVRDLVQRGGDDFAYRLTVAPPRAERPDFDVVLRYEEPLRLNRGAKAKLWANVTRKGDFKGDVTVTLHPLPPGVTVRPLRVSATQPSSGVFTLSADGEAPLGYHPMGVVATGIVGDEVVSKTLPADPRLGVVSSVYVTVQEPAPFRIERVGPAAQVDPKPKAEQIAALEKTLATRTPQLDESQARWEKSLNLAAAWEVLDVIDADATSRAKLAKQPDGSLLAQGPPNKPTPAKDKYLVTTSALTPGIRSIRLEAIAQSGQGPGRSENGNFVLSEFAVAAAPLANPTQTKPVELASATATFEQGGFPASDSITRNIKPDGGWAIYPEGGRSHHATYVLKDPLPADGGARLVFTLDQSSKYPQHVLGQFRLLATSAEKPDDKLIIPSAVLSILRVAADKRTAEQKGAVAAYYRTIAPELAEARGKLANLKGASAGAFPPVLQANKTAEIELAVVRLPGFTGEITLTVEGFSAGLDPQTNQPAPITKNFEAKPVTLKADQSEAKLVLKANGTPEKGTRDAIVRAEATHNGAKYLIYSGIFPITVK
jgi:hypothetical protein